ncbi:MAG: DNRLRE domain-containing protein [Anaerolineae bacterium]
MELPNNNQRTIQSCYLCLGLLITLVCVGFCLLAGADPFNVAMAEDASGSHPNSDAASVLVEQIYAKQQSMATGTAVMRVDPESSFVAKDDIFTVDVMVDAGDEKIITVFMYLDFNPLYLRVVDASGNPTSTIEVSEAFDFVPKNSVDNGIGQIDLEVGVMPGTPEPSGTFRVATIRFKALWGTGGGSAPLTFVSRGGNPPAVYNLDGNDVLAETRNGQVTISGETPPVTPTPTPTRTSTSTPTSTATPTHTVTMTPTNTPTKTASPTITPTPVGTPKILEFQDGVSPVSSYSGMQDTYLDSWSPTEPKGSEIDLRLITNGARRLLVKCDFSPYLPSGAQVVGAKLYLFAYWASNNDASTDIEAYRVNRHWEEGTATWNSPWTTPGCDKIPEDRELMPAATARVGNVGGTGLWVEWDITQLVQEWASGSVANEGVILIAPYQYHRHLYFRSSDVGDKAHRPKVEVRYYDPLPTPTPTHTATPTNTPTPTVTLTPTPVPGRIEGVVWNDWNGNGIKDAGEPGLAGAVVRVYDAAHPDPEPPIRDPIVTAGDGAFSFGELPPNSYLVVVAAPPNYILTTTERANVLVSSGVTVQVNFGAWILATPTPTVTSSPTPTLTATSSPTPTWTATPSPSPSLTPTRTATPWHRIFIPIIYSPVR